MTIPMACISAARRSEAQPAAVVSNVHEDHTWIPMILLFLAGQRPFIRGLAEGFGKG